MLNGCQASAGMLLSLYIDESKAHLFHFLPASLLNFIHKGFHYF